MYSGVFDRYPTLKIILGHCGEMLPFVLNRIDKRVRHFEHYWPGKHTATHYFENNFYVTTAGVQDSATLADTIRQIGEDRVMFSVDYPYEDNVEILMTASMHMQLVCEVRDKRMHLRTISTPRVMLYP